MSEPVNDEKSVLAPLTVDFGELFKFAGGMSVGLNREDYLKQITDYLGQLSHQVEVRGSIRLLDLNIAAEDFYCGFLNLVYDLNLVNLNCDEPNAKAIDLGDKTNRKSIQVTSDNSLAKIRKTVTGFDDDGRDADYDELVVLRIAPKKKHKTLPAPAKATLRVINHLDLMQDIRNKCSSVESLVEIVSFLESELVTNPKGKSDADAQILETFADNASRYIAQVAEHIVVDIRGVVPAQELNGHELLTKFSKMKCTSSYKNKFDRHAAFFPAVNEVIETDAVKGGANTIRAIIGIIESIYSEVLEQSANGDRIHNQIQATLTGNGSYTPEEVIAAETLIFYTIGQCGIFNEAK